MKNILLILTILSSSAFANRITPESSNDGKTRNRSVLAVANERRTYFNTQFESKSLEVKGEDKLDTDDFDFDGAFANRVFSIEWSYDDQSGFGLTEPLITEVNQQRTSVVLLGFRPVDRFSFGLGYRNIEKDSNLVNTNKNQYEIEGGVTYNHGLTITGLSYKYVRPVSSEDGSYSDTTIGVGYKDEVLNVESGFIISSDSDELNRGARTTYFIGATRQIKKFELDGDIDYVWGDNTVDAGDYTYTKFNFDLEYMVGRTIYLTPGYTFEKLEINSSEINNSSVNLDLGYREDGMDVVISFNFLADGELDLPGSNTELSSSTFKIGMSSTF